MKLNKGEIILFQGDSITDAGRERPKVNPPKSRNNIHHLGAGYAAKAAGMLLAGNPGLDLTIHNRGISGNRVTDLRNRWQDDCFVLKPTLVSILIGVNDCWHGVAKGTPEKGVPLGEFDRVLRELVKATRKALPGVRIVLCEPFTTQAGAVLELNFHPDIDERRAIVRTIAGEMADVFVPFQEMFDDLVKVAPASYWADDGVHPTPGGHQKMAEFWIKRVLA
jgi:lysophospholipase L1-like esterase